MKIHWHNLFAALLVLLAVILAIRQHRAIRAWLDHWEQVRPRPQWPEHVTGLLVILGCALLLAAAIRLWRRE